MWKKKYPWCIIYNKLSSKSHLKSIFKNTCQKFNVLCYISHYTQRNQWKVLANVFIKSQFSYCPLIWMSYSKGLNSKGKRMHKTTQSTWKWQWIWLGTSTATVTWRKRFTSSMAIFLGEWIRFYGKMKLLQIQEFQI